jgi:hypothetical protein
MQSREGRGSPRQTDMQVATDAGTDAAESFSSSDRALDIYDARRVAVLLCNKRRGRRRGR